MLKHSRYKEVAMKSNYILRLANALVSIIIFLTIAFFNFTVKANDITVTSNPEIMKLDKKGSATLMGSGFAPGQAIRILFVKDGVRADIGHYLKPKPEPDSYGKWNTVWSYGRFVKKKIIKEGDYKFMITDESYKEIYSTKLKFK